MRPRPDYTTDEIKRGEIIAYPATLRREHGFERSILVVEGVDKGFVRCLRRDGLQVSVYPNQLKQNGVLLMPREAENSQSRSAK